eukprot:1638221-Amphidinium_carterae.1
MSEPGFTRTTPLPPPSTPESILMAALMDETSSGTTTLTSQSQPGHWLWIPQLREEKKQLE